MSLSMWLLPGWLWQHGWATGIKELNPVRVWTHYLHHHEAGAGEQAAGWASPAPDEGPLPPPAAAWQQHRMRETQDFGSSLLRTRRWCLRRRGTGAAQGGGGLQGNQYQPGTPASRAETLASRAWKCASQVTVYTQTHILHLHYLNTFVSMMYFTVNTTLK